MWWLKMIGMISIAFGCTGIGMEHTGRMRRRIWTLREMERALNLFRGFTETYRLPLEIVCKKISEQVDEPLHRFFLQLSESLGRQDETKSDEIWRKTIKSQEKAFDEEDQMLFLQIGDFLGGQNLEIQNQVLSLCMKDIRERIHLLEKERPQREKLYRILSLTVSGFLILFFL